MAFDDPHFHPLSLSEWIRHHWIFLSWRRKWQPTAVFLPGESHGGRSLAGYSPWGRRESDMTERRLHQMHRREANIFPGPFVLWTTDFFIREGNGTPLQYSCLENPRDGRAWWAAVYGVAQSWTRLKRLSSSSSSSSIFSCSFISMLKRCLIFKNSNVDQHVI